MNTRLDLILKLFDAALVYARSEAGAWRVMRAPEITREGLIAVDALVDHRADLRVAANEVARRGLSIPAASRQRRIVAALAKFIPGVANEVRHAEKWFSINVVRAMAGATDSIGSEPEAAGYIAAAIILVGAKDQIRDTAGRLGVQTPW